MQQTLSFFETVEGDYRLPQIYSDILGITRYESLTAREIAQRLGYADSNKVRPRINELMKLGKITPMEHRNCTVSGKYVIAWRAIK